MLIERKPLSAAFSEDGYIIDQDCFHEYRYRTMRADINSCGWIAAYNIRHFLGQNAAWDDVRREMEEMHVLNIPGPTHMRVMRQYLNKYIPDVRVTAGREQALEEQQQVPQVFSVTGKRISRTLFRISAGRTELSGFSMWRQIRKIYSYQWNNLAGSIFKAAG